MREGREVQQPLAQLQGGADQAEEQAERQRAPACGGEPGQQADQRDRDRGQHPDRRELHHRCAQHTNQFPAGVAGVQPVGQAHGQPGTEQSSGRAEDREDEVAARPLQPAHRGCQDRLGPPAGLLGPQPEGGLDGIGRRQQSEQAHHAREVRVDEAAAATHAGEDVLQVAVALQQVPDAVGDAAEHDADDGQPRGPAGQQAPVQPPGQFGNR